MIFNFFNLVSGLSCCTGKPKDIQVKVEYVDLELGQNTLYDYHSDIFGYYAQQNHTINGKDHFISLSNDGKNAIWATNGRWAIGLTENLGSDRYDAYLISEEYCPNRSKYKRGIFCDSVERRQRVKVPLTEGKWKYSLPDGWFNAGDELEVIGLSGGYVC